MEDIISFLQENKFSYKDIKSGDTHIQIDCPLCGDTRKRLGIKLKGDPKAPNPWRCFNCSGRGLSFGSFRKAVTSLRKLNRKTFVEHKEEQQHKEMPLSLAEKCHELLLKEHNQDKLLYLTDERKISVEAVKHFKLGFRSKFKNKDNETYDAGPHIAIPGFEDGKLVYMKYRSIDPEVDKKFKWRREKGCKSILFNDDTINDHEFDEIFIAEAELDCITMWDNGFRNTIGLTAGADTFENFQEWYDKLERFKKVYIVLDSDEAGQLGAKKIAKRLGLGRCYNIVLPDDAKDPNDYFKKYTPRDFEQLKDRAVQFNPEDVQTLLQMTNDQITALTSDKILSTGYSTGFESIDRVLGPLQPGNMIVVAARPKAGKTITVMNFLFSMAKLHNISSFNYQCEMEKSDMVTAYTNMGTKGEAIQPLPQVERDSEGLPLFKSKKQKDDYEEIKERNLDLLKTARIKVPMRKLISFHPQTPNELELDKVCEKITEVVQRFNCKVVVFDNLHFLCRGDDSKEKVDMASQRFKMLARQLGIIFFLVTHPRKTNHNRELENDDLKESASIFQDADAVILLHREYEDMDDVEENLADTQMMSKIMKIKVTARRHQGGRCKVIFNGNQSLIIDDKSVLEKEKEKTDGNKKKDAIEE